MHPPSILGSLTGFVHGLAVAADHDTAAAVVVVAAAAAALGNWPLLAFATSPAAEHLEGD